MKVLYFWAGNQTKNGVLVQSSGTSELDGYITSNEEYRKVSKQIREALAPEYRDGFVITSFNMIYMEGMQP